MTFWRQGKEDRASGSAAEPRRAPGVRKRDQIYFRTSCSAEHPGNEEGQAAAAPHVRLISGETAKVTSHPKMWLAEEIPAGSHILPFKAAVSDDTGPFQGTGTTGAARKATCYWFGDNLFGRLGFLLGPG